MRLYLFDLGRISTGEPILGYLVQTAAGKNVLIDTGYRPGTLGEDPAGLDHSRVGIRVEIVKRERFDAGRGECFPGAVDITGGHDSRIGDDERARKGEIAGQLAQPAERAVAEHHSSARVKFE